jgi:PhnB protein
VLHNQTIKMKQPQQHNTAMPYLIADDPLALQTFLRTVFDAVMLIEVPRSEHSGLLHAEAKIGDSTIMFSGSSEQWKAQTAGIFIYVEDADSAFSKAINLGATEILPVEDKDYGRSCGVQDTNGNIWWITSIK